MEEKAIRYFNGKLDNYFKLWIKAASRVVGRDRAKGVYVVGIKKKVGDFYVRECIYGFIVEDKMEIKGSEYLQQCRHE